MQEFICASEDILGHHPEWGDRDCANVSPMRIATTLSALLAHDLPKDTADPFDTSDYASDVTETSIELNYRQKRSRYNEDRYVSNFNEFHQYTIDESEEYQIYDNNNVEQNGHYSPVYGTDGLRNRGPYYQTNKVQFVTPFYKGELVLKNDNFEIYDTDEIDCPAVRQEDNLERYDRTKMNLEIENNLNRDLNIETDVPEGEENRLLVTCLCLGAFFLSAILLIVYPL